MNVQNDEDCWIVFDNREQMKDSLKIMLQLQRYSDGEIKYNHLKTSSLFGIDPYTNWTVIENYIENRRSLNELYSKLYHSVRYEVYDDSI